MLRERERAGQRCPWEEQGGAQRFEGKQCDRKAGVAALGALCFLYLPLEDTEFVLHRGRLFIRMR